MYKKYIVSSYANSFASLAKAGGGGSGGVEGVV